MDIRKLIEDTLPDLGTTARKEAYTDKLVALCKAYALSILPEEAFTDYPDTPEGRQMRHENMLFNSAIQKAKDKINS